MTSTEDVDVIRYGLREETDMRVCLLNYRKNGTAFLNQFNLSALRDVSGRLVSFYWFIVVAIILLHFVELQTEHERSPDWLLSGYVFTVSWGGWGGGGGALDLLRAGGHWVDFLESWQALVFFNYCTKYRCCYYSYNYYYFYLGYYLVFSFVFYHGRQEAEAAYFGGDFSVFL